jgi:hypothetical protein
MMSVPALEFQEIIANTPRIKPLLERDDIIEMIMNTGVDVAVIEECVRETGKVI